PGVRKEARQGCLHRLAENRPRSLWYSVFWYSAGRGASLPVLLSPDRGTRKDLPDASIPSDSDQRYPCTVPSLILSQMRQIHFTRLPCKSQAFLWERSAFAA